jgi:hypothetical protein
MAARADVRRHDRQIAERDEDLEEWIIVRHRKLKQRFSEITQQANAAGVSRGGTITAGQTAVRTELLYDYREELRQAHAFVLRIDADERWMHRAARRLPRRRAFPTLTTPTGATRLVDYWEDGTARNALTWSLENILAEPPQRPTDRAIEVDVDVPRQARDRPNLTARRHRRSAMKRPTGHPSGNRGLLGRLAGAWLRSEAGWVLRRPG